LGNFFWLNHEIQISRTKSLEQNHKNQITGAKSQEPNHKLQIKETKHQILNKESKARRLPSAEEIKFSKGLGVIAEKLFLSF